MTLVQAVVAIVVLLGFFAAILGSVVAASVVLGFERAERRTDQRWQEREAQSRLRPRTGMVEAAPRLAPLADVLPFPERDDRPAA